MKKLKYLFPIILFFLTIDVFAYNLPYPSSYYFDTASDTAHSVSVSLDLWWGTNQNTDFYYHSANIGDFGSPTPRIYRVDYNFVNLNLCSNQDISITGLLGGPGNLFDQQSYDIQIHSNGTPLSCAFTKIAGNKIQYNCFGRGGGTLSYYFWENSFTTNVSYMVGVNRNVTYSCDVSNQSIVSQSIQNTNAIINNQNQNTNAIINSQNNTTNAITSESDPNTNSSIQGFNNTLASDTPITDLITMPLTLINAYINGMNSSCTAYNFGSLLGTNLTMPCINLQQRLGSNIWSIIDVLFSIFMIFNISKLFIGAFNNFTSLKDDFSNMYTNDYQPKHGGDD